MSRFTSIVVISVIVQTVLLRGFSCASVQGNTQLSQEEIERLKKIGEEVKSKLSSDRDPCVDFYGYVCAKSTKSNSTRRRISDVDQMAPIVENYLLKTEKLTSSEEKLKAYLTACKKYKVDDIKKFVREFDLPESIGGWPAFNSNWKADKFDWITAMAELESYESSVIFDQDFEFSHKTSKSQFIISLGDFDLTQSETKKEKLLKKISKLEIENSDNLLNDAEQFEKECIEVVVEQKVEEEHIDETDFAGLKQKIPEIDWDKQMEIVRGKKMADDFPVVIKDGKILRKLINKISEMNPKIVANYFFCSFVYHAPEFDEDDLGDQCIVHAIRNFMGVASEILAKEYFIGNSRIMLSGMIDSLLQTFKDSSHIFKETAISDIIGNNDHFSDDEYIQSLTEECRGYENIKADPNDFLRTVYSITQNQVKETIEYFCCENPGRLTPLKEILKWMLSGSLHIASNQPSFSAYTTIASESLKDYMEGLSSKAIKKSVLECMSEFDKDMGDRRIAGLIGFKLLIKGYNDWANKNENLLQAEDEILKDYDLTSRKTFLIRLLQDTCGPVDPEATKRLSSFFWSVDQFVNTFNCEGEPPVKPLNKCEL